jgi:hypothetical protein
MPDKFDASQSMRPAIDEKVLARVIASALAPGATTLAARPREWSDCCTQLILDGPFAETKEIIIG